MARRRAQRGIFMVRTLAIAAVLLIMLMIPLWMHKGSDSAPKSRGVKIVATPATAAASAAPTTPVAQRASALEGVGASAAATPAPVVASAPAGVAASAAATTTLGQGLTYALQPTTASQADRATLACAAPAGAGVQPERCQPQTGDTSCRVVLPVLCVRPNGQGGMVLGATGAVMGAVLGTAEAGHQRCTAELGAGWRMAGVDGERAVLDGAVYGVLPRDTRYWVRSPHAQGNCWGTPS